MPTIKNIDNYTWVVMWQDVNGESYVSYCYTESAALELVKRLGV